MVSRVNVVLWAGLLLAILGSVCSKPCLDSLWCDMMCDDDDVSTTATTTEDILDRFLCSGCPPRRRRPATPRPGSVPPFSILLGGSTMNMAMAPVNGTWVLSYAPMGGAPPPAVAPAAPVAAASAPAPVAVPPAPAPAAAPAAAVPAPAAAAAAATTPAPTTKKP